MTEKSCFDFLEGDRLFCNSEHPERHWVSQMRQWSCHCERHGCIEGKLKYRPTGYYVPGNSVGIATGYGLDSTGIESRWRARYSAPVQTGPGAHPASCTMGTGFFSGVKYGRCLTLTPHSLLVPCSWKSRAIPLCPYGPYGLYRATVPVQGSTLHFFHNCLLS